MQIKTECDYGCEDDDCGHTQCPTCETTCHSCAGCDSDYCECSEAEWAEGKNGITYCSQECANNYGRDVRIEVGGDLPITHSVQILWGQHPDDDDDICEYRFRTKAEVDAFFVGVEAAEGWSDWEIIDLVDVDEARCINQ